MAIQQSHFRIRTVGADQALNANGAGDWAANLDVDATLDALVEHGGCLFGLRFELEEIDATSTTITPKVQYRVNAGTWTDCADVGSVDDYIAPTNNTTVTNVVVVNKATITDGAATTNILSGSSKGFVAGTGEHNTIAAGITLNDQHTEIEWRILIRNRWGSRQQSVTGDDYEFRVVESDGTLLGGTYVIPTITLNLPNGYIGGCAVESPGSNIFVQTPSGTLYTLVESDETSAEPVMLKSTDGGDTWLQQDAGAAIGDTDLESAAMVYDDTNKVIHVLHVSGAVTYYQYATEDHATETTDAWIDARTTTLNASMDASNQTGDLVMRGTNLYAFYPDLNTTEQVYYNKKSDLTTGTWGGEVSVDTTGGTTDFAGVAAVLGPNSNDIHIFYSDYSNLDIFHRTLNASDVLGTIHTIETDLRDSAGVPIGLTNAICWYNGSVEKAMIGFSDATNEYLWTVIVEDDGTPNARQNASNSVVILENPLGMNSRQPVASLGHDPNTDITYVLYVDETTQDLWRATNSDGAGWTGHTEQLDGVRVHSVRARVFTHATGIHGGDTVLGWLSENAYNPDSGSPQSGFNGAERFDEFQIAAGSVDTSDNQSAYTEGLRIFPFAEDFSVGSNGDPWRISHWVTDAG